MLLLSITLMPMQMMRIRHMRMCVLHRLVAMRVTVRSFRHRVVSMQVVTVIMTVGVFMLQGFVAMWVRM